jgi:NCS1 nucleoside transporter family
MTEAALPEAILEAELSAQYHQPKGVEQFGVEAIPDDLKTVRWYDLFFIVINFMINPGNILIGGMAVVAGLSFWASVAAETVGCLVAFCAYIVMATIGIDYGLPGQVATRMTFGLRGSKWLPSLLRSIASTYWFAFQTVAGSLVIVDVIDHWFGGHHSLLLVSIIFGVAQVVVAVVGYDSLKLLSRIAFPLKVIILIYLFYLLSHHTDPNFHPARVFHYAGTYGWQWAVFVVWFNGMLASWLTMITDAADFCRYSRTRADMWIGTMLAVLCGTLFGGGLGAYAAAAVQGASYNPFTIVSSIHDTHLTLLLILIVIIFDNWTINVLNLYTGGLSVNNIFEKIGRFWTTLAIGVLGVALSAFPSLVNGYVGFTTALGNLFAPLAGVLLADYLFLRRGRIDVPALYQPHGVYWYWKGANLIAVAWVLAGFGLYFFTPPAWVQTIFTLLVTGAGYLLTMKLMLPRSANLRRSLEAA